MVMGLAFLLVRHLFHQFTLPILTSSFTYASMDRAYFVKLSS